MAKKLVTRNVFLDTEVFTAVGFNFGISTLSELKNLGRDGKIAVLISESTADECRKRIQKMVSTAANWLKDGSKEQLQILRQAPSLATSWFWKIDKETVAAEIVQGFDKFLEESKAIVCPLSGVSIQKLFGDYIAGNPPFGDGQKKDQFPDAIALLSLAKWCADNSAKAYVVSKDKDVESVCTANSKIFLHKSQLAEFLDLFNQNEEELTEMVRTMANSHKRWIEREIERKFEDATFALLDEEGEVEDVDVESVRADEPLVIAVHDGYALVELPVRVEYTASVTYIDLPAAFYDREERWYHGRERVRSRIRRTEKTNAEIEFEFDRNAPDDADMSVVGFDRATFHVHLW